MIVSGCTFCTSIEIDTKCGRTVFSFEAVKRQVREPREIQSATPVNFRN